MNELELSTIQSKIYHIRGYDVMLDFDLAELYRMETANIKRQVRRNIDRFPSDFMFELTIEEFQDLRCQSGISNWGGTRYLPFAFTEHGVTMLPNVLQSKRAIEVSIQIVRAFVAMRQFFLNPPINEVKLLQNEVRQLKEYIENVFADYNDINEDTRMELELINQTLAEIQSKNKWLDKPRKPIGFIQPKNDNG